jgi:predicted RNA polymerase sigma factor
VLGAVIRRFRDFAACEDAVQEALIAAAVQWPVEGLPDNPAGWLTRVASRRMADHVRSEASRRRRESAVAAQAVDTVPAADAGGGPDGDDTLILLFMCCHPALTTSSAIALTLRAVGGLTTAEIARAFFVPESTMAQRISRAKQTIRSSGVPFVLPTASERTERVTAVLHVLYLIFSEGYTTSAGPDLQRPDLSTDAIRLARAVHRQIPDDGEVAGLLAAIAAVHDEAPTAADTDWPQILALYGLLMLMSDNPMVRLNHAIAVAMVEGPSAGLERLDRLEADGRLSGHHRLAAVRAHLLERAGDTAAVIIHYRMAADRTANVPERNYLLTQAARLAEQMRAEDGPA